MHWHFGYLILLLALNTLLAGCTRVGSQASSTTDAQRVTLELNWFPEVEHGGYYAALVHDEFSAEGLDVVLVPGGPNVPVLQDVAAGKADFGVTNADQLLFARAAGADLVALLAPLQDSPRCIMVHEETGITKFAELRDVTLAVGSSAAFFRYVAAHTPLEGVEIVAYTGSIAPFLESPRYAQQAYVFSEPILAAMRGATTRCLMVSELGYNPYTSVLITRREVIDQQPELVAKVVRAAVLGWQHYLENPEPTNKRLLSENREMSAEVLARGARELLPLCRPGDGEPHRFGLMTIARWRELDQQMRDTELLDAGSSDKDLSDDVSAAFTTQFLPARVAVEPGTKAGP